MTIEEVSAKYGVSMSSLKNVFPRVKQSIMKKYGIEIIKEGRGASANYIEIPLHITDNRAMVLYDEMKEDISLGEESFQLQS